MRLTHIAAVSAIMTTAGLASAAEPTYLDKFIAKLINGKKIASSAASAVATPRSTDVAGFDVAGVQLGMTPEQARGALIAGGFKPRAQDPTQDSWENLVTAKVSERRQTPRVDSKVPMFTMAEGPRGEHLEVWYAATQEGARASSVKYSIPVAQMTPPAFWTAVDAKYGAATGGSQRDRLYCARAEPECTTWAPKKEAWLEASQDYASFTIALTGSTREAGERRATLEAEVERRAPRDAKASF